MRKKTTYYYLYTYVLASPKESDMNYELQIRKCRIDFHYPASEFVSVHVFNKKGTRHETVRLVPKKELYTSEEELKFVLALKGEVL